MKHLAWLLMVVVVSFSMACNSSSKSNQKGEDTLKFKPATPAGTVAVAITGMDEDEQKVHIKFSLNGKDKEETFDLKVAQGYNEAELYSVLWDKPNSAYIALLKENKQTRYYHAFEKDGIMRILHHNSPPKEIWTYVEEVKGFGQPNKNASFVTGYSKEIQSGSIISDFKVFTMKTNVDDSIMVHYSFGGADLNKGTIVPPGAVPTIRVDKDDRVMFGFKAGEQFMEVLDIWVKDGRLGAKQIRFFRKS